MHQYTVCKEYAVYLLYMYIPFYCPFHKCIFKKYAIQGGHCARSGSGIQNETMQKSALDCPSKRTAMPQSFHHLRAKDCQSYCTVRYCSLYTLLLEIAGYCCTVVEYRTSCHVASFRLNSCNLCFSKGHGNGGLDCYSCWQTNAAQAAATALGARSPSSYQHCKQTPICLPA